MDLVVTSLCARASHIGLIGFDAALLLSRAQGKELGYFGFNEELDVG
jgi:hypothetical protein